MKLSFLLITASITTIFLSGCMVSESKYLKKVDDADLLSKSLLELKEQHDKLNTENSELKTEYNKLKVSSTLLSKDKNNLEQILNSKPDALSKSISELRQKIDSLETENKKHHFDTESLNKTKEEKVKEVSNTYEQLLQKMKNEIANGQVTISELKGRLTVNIESAILFDPGNADLKASGLTVLHKMIEPLASIQDKVIRIEGHTDNMPVSNSIFPSNWELSATQAINICKYLQQQGLDPAVLSATAFAEHKPVAGNSTREGRAKNRRIEIILVTKD